MLFSPHVIKNESYPVNLVKVIGFHHCTADDASAISSSHVNFNPAKEDVEVTLDGWGITLFRNSELGAKGSALNSAISGVPLAEC